MNQSVNIAQRIVFGHRTGHYLRLVLPISTVKLQQLRKTFLCLLLCLATSFALSAQTTFYVSTAGNDTNDGLSWGNAYRHLQTAIGAAASGDEIWVAAGTYYPDEGTGQTNDARASSFTLKDGVDVYGGFVGTETIRTQRNWSTNATILSGDIGTVDNRADNSYHVVVAADNTILDGFTINHGNANGSGTDRFGGGIFINNSSPTITNVVISSNSASLFGGGIYSELSSSSPVLTNAIISGNTADAGAGLCMQNGLVTFVNVTISGNKAASYGGGAFFNIGRSTLDLTNVVLWNNQDGTGIGTSSSSIRAFTSDDRVNRSYSLVQGYGADGTNLDTDPLFVLPLNPGNAPSTAGDFRLRVGSPAIDAGDNSLNTETLDLAGDARIQNATINLGAFETVLNSPTLSTTAATGIDFTKATFGGNISGNGSAAVTERGIVYALTSENGDPQLNGTGVTKEIIGSGSGIFSQEITGLLPGKGYAYRAYAINAVGESYGALETFTTRQSPGNVNAELALWVKSGTDARNGGSSAVDTDPVTAWTDLSGIGTNEFTNTGLTSPIFKDNATDNINYNSVVDFTGSGALKYPSGIYASGTGTEDGMTWFSIIKPDDAPSAKTRQFVFDIGNFAGEGYGLIYGDEVAGAYSSTDHGGAYQAETAHTNGINTTLARLTIDFASSQSLYFNAAATPFLNSAITLSQITTNEVDFNTANGTNTGPFTLGRQSKSTFLNNNGGRDYDGKIAEIIGYRSVLTSTEVNQIESYLAIKYGITKDNTGGSTAGDYLASDASLLWDADHEPSYHQNVIGIGRDDGQQFMQKQSKTNDNSMKLYAGTLAQTNSANSATFSEAMGYVLIGNNTGAMLPTTSELSASGVASRLAREWKVTKTSFDDTFSLDLTLDGSINPADITASRLQLLVDTDGDFSNGGTTVLANGTNGLSISHSSGVITVSGISADHLPNNATSYITVGNILNTTPGVITTAAAGISFREATLGGEVAENGGETVTDRGIVYALTSANATLEIGEGGVTQVTLGSGAAVFSELVTGLAPGTSYQYKAYATNTLGTTYGPFQTFSTSSPAIIYSGTGFTETGDNLGAVSGEIIATITGAAFKDPLSADDFTLGNIPDGLTPSVNVENAGEWIPRSGSSSLNLTSVAYGNGLYVAISANGIMTSSDGITWSFHFSIPNGGWQSVTYGNGLFVAVGSKLSSTNHVMTSPDGINWTAQTAPTMDLFAVTYGNGKFVAMGSPHGLTLPYVMTSVDGETWSATTNGTVLSRWRSVIYANGKFVAVADNSNQVMTSLDGEAWSVTSNGVPRSNWQSVTYGNGLFVAVGFNNNVSNDGNQVMTSSDGITWTARAVPGVVNRWGSVTYGNDRFVAVDDQGTHRLITSVDGIVWTLVDVGTDISWSSVIFANGKFVAVGSVNSINSGNSNNIMTSSNITRAIITLPGTATSNNDTEDVADITFTFADAAFTDATAAGVTNATGPASSSLGIDFTQNPVITYSGPGFVETPTNTGEVTGRIVVTLEGANFDNSPTVENNLNLQNLPNGLTPSIVIRTDRHLFSQLTIFLTGTAINSDDTDDVADITFAFNDAAFTTGTAAIVNNATGPANSGIGIDFNFDASPPVITSDGGAATASLSVSENTAAVTTVTATDVDVVSTISYSITGGADQVKFAIESNSGILTFDPVQDFENPADADTDNAYEVEVTASDGSNQSSQNITVTITNAPDAPVFTSTAVTTASDNASYIYSIATADDEGDAVSVTATTKPSWLSLDTDATVSSLTKGVIPAFLDGPGSDALFSTPNDVVADAAGNIYVADYFNNRIRKIGTDGVVSTVAGAGGPSGLVDGTGVNARFNSPAGIDIDASGNLYIADQFNAVIRKIDPNGVVTTFAGSGTYGGADGLGTAADFGRPSGIAVDAAGNVYVADSGNSMIRKIAPNGQVSTLAGSFEVFSFKNGTGTDAHFLAPRAIAVDAAGNVYVTDTGNHLIRKIDVNGVVTTVAGAVGVMGSLDGTGTQAQFNNPSGLTVDSSGNIYVGDRLNHLIRKIDVNGVVTTVVGTAGVGFDDNLSSLAKLNSPNGLDIDTNGDLIFASNGNHAIRKLKFSDLALNGDATGRAGQHNVVLEATDGNGGTATQSFVVTVNDVTFPVFTSATIASFAENGTGTVYTATATDTNPGATLTYSFFGTFDKDLFDLTAGGVLTFKTAPDFENPTDSDADNSYGVSLIVSDGTNQTTQNVTINVTNVNEETSITSTAVTSIADNAPLYEYAIATSDVEGDDVTVSVTAKPSWLTLDSAPDGVVSSPYGSGVAGFLDGSGTGAQFDNPGAIAFDKEGNLYVVDRSNFSIRKINSAGEVSTLAGSGNSQIVDGTGTAASFEVPRGIAVDSQGNVYVAEGDEQTIRKITPEGVVTTFAGSGNAQIQDGTGTGASFLGPQAMAVDAFDNLFVVNLSSISKVTPEAVVTTFAGAGSGFGMIDGTGTAARFSGTTGITIDKDNNIYVIDIGRSIRKITDQAVVTTFFNGSGAPFATLSDITVDDSGNIYGIARDYPEIVKIDLSGVVTSFVSDRNPGFVDGTGTNARFNHPLGLAFNDERDLYVGDSRNHRIRKVTVGRNILTGDPSGQAGTHNVTLQASDGNGGTDTQSFVITVTDATAPVFTSATTASSVENVTGTVYTAMATDDNTNATLSYSLGTGNDNANFNIAAASGALSFTSAPDFEIPTDTNLDNSYLIEVKASDGVNEVAQMVTITVTNVNEAPSFTSSAVTAVDDDQNYSYTITISDDDADELTVTAPTLPAWLSLSTSTGFNVSTIAGSTEGTLDGTGTSAQFNDPVGIARDGAGNIYIAEAANHRIRKIDPSGVVSTIAGSTQGYADGTGVAAQFDQPSGIALDGAGNLIIADFNNNRIRKLDLATAQVTTIAGSSTIGAAGGTADGAGNLAEFNGPFTVAIDQLGNIYVADLGNHRIRKIAPSFIVSTLAGSTPGFADGIGTAAQFTAPYGVTVDGFGNVYISDTGNHKIRKVSSTGVVTTVAGSTLGNTDGAPTVAQFNTPAGLVVDAQGNIFVSDLDNHLIRKVDPAGVVSTIAGTGTAGVLDGLGASAQFNQPFGITLGTSGDLYVADVTNNLVRKLTKDFSISGSAAGQAGNHNVILEVSDGNGGTNQQSFTINVNDVTSPVFTSSTSASFVENGTGTAYTAGATDSNTNATLTYSLGTGNDENLFNIAGATGVVTFKTSPDFEIPSDANTDNGYVIQVKASDGSNEVSQTVTISVTNADDNNPVITSDGGGATASVNINENATAITTLTSTDADAISTVTYSITGGADQTAFGIGSTSGVLTLNAAQDFESPADSDGNNSYIVEVTATDGTNSDVQTITVTVQDVDDNSPVITSDGGGATASVNTDENTTSVTTVIATDADAISTVIYSITGGADQTAFGIVSNTGVLTLNAAQDFESQTDSDGNNSYIVEVTATDGTNSDVQTITVNVQDVEDNSPVITSDGGGATASLNINENITAVTTVTATDADAISTVTYSITGGADQTSFGIVSTSGVLTLNAAQDFENPTDNDGNNSYIVEVTTTDGTNSDVQTITVTVQDVDDNKPVITSDGGGATTSLNINENATAVTTVVATDADAISTLTYSITGGADQPAFGIVSTTGVLTLNAAQDFENPTDSDGNNSYVVEVTATDGTNSDVQTITVSIQDVNDNNPVITSDGGGATASLNINENVTAVTTVLATDADAISTVTYSITGGADQTVFAIVSNTGVLTLNTAQDFENPADSDGNNSYIVEITATDGTNSDVQTITVSLQDVEDNSPVITSDEGGVTASLNINENATAVTTVIATDLDASSTVTYSITGGADQTAFGIISTTGVLTLNLVPDFERPTDNDGNNSYVVEVTATDGTNSDVQTITITIQDLNDSAPVITSDGGGATASLNINENATAVTTVMATDADAGNTISYTITGGTDQAAFSIISNTGVLTLNAAQDFERPTDSDGDNSYLVEITASDGINSDVQTITVNIQDVEDNTPVITSDGGGVTASLNINENATAVTTIIATDADAISTVTYSITGGADQAAFGIVSNTGILTLNPAPDFESPADSDGNNSYIVEVTATDGTNTDVQTITVSIQDVNDNNPVITSDGGGATASLNINENATAVTTVIATDADAISTVTYSITGGADQAVFAVVSNTGILSLNAAQDFENLADNDGNNSYIVEVTATDGTNTDVQTITVSIQDVDDNNPVITSDGGGATASLNINENVTAVTTVIATDADAISTVTYSITGGADQTAFGIVSTTGGLTLNSAQDFESPADSGGNNSYIVEVTATDGTNTDVQTITVNIQDADESAPVITSDGGAATASINVNEGATSVTTITSTDADIISTVTYNISGGSDQSLFSLTNLGGVLTFNMPRDFEDPTDSDGNNTYVVEVTATDGINSDDTQTITVTITDVDDATPVITSDGGGVTASISIAENTSAITTVTATDADANSTITYSITGGVDQQAFSIVSATGVLSLNAAADFENPVDNDGNNSYVVEVTASDGTNNDLQTITVTIQDLDDSAPVITSDGGLATASINLNENVTAVTTVMATDADAISTITYSITGGTDQSAFSIVSNTGVLTLNVTPDFESPTDSDGNNSFIVEVTATDGTNSDMQTITITIKDLNDNDPVITSDGGGATANLNINENTTTVTRVVATDADAVNTITYSITGGTDQTGFGIISNTGVLSLNAAADFESPTDNDGDNSYIVEVTATDGTNTDAQIITVNIQDVEDNTPIITSDGGGATASLNINENTTAVTTVMATDADAISTVSYAITGGADQAAFAIENTTGILTLNSGADFENPVDADGGNNYEVEISATDGTNTDVQTLTVNVLDVDEIAPVPSLTSPVSTLVNTSFELQVSYSEPVSNFTLTDLEVTNGTASNLVSIVSGEVWTVLVTPLADGVVTVELPANSVADAAGNGNQAAAVFSITNDQTVPTVVLSATSISEGTFEVTMQFSEPVSGFDLTDITIDQGASDNFTTIDVSTYTFELSSGTGVSQVSVEANVATDMAGNGNAASSVLEIVFNSSPTDIGLSNASIDENNESGATIGEFTSTDADASDTHTYALVSGTGDTGNASFSIDGNILKAAESFDFESQSSFSIRLSTNDGRGGIFEKVFDITINNVGEPVIEITGEVDFDETPLGVTRSTPITLTNTGDATTEVIVVSSPADFSVTPGSVILAGGESAEINVNFTPTQAMDYAGELIFSYAGQQVMLSVSGIGAIITGTDDQVLDPAEINLHPNPASDILNIDLSQVHAPKLDINIINAQGISVFELSDHKEKQLRIRVSDYESGIYIIQFADGKSSIRKKVIIRK